MSDLSKMSEKLEDKIRVEIRKLFHRHDVVSVSLKGVFPDFYIDVGLSKNDDNFPQFLRIDSLDGKVIPIKTKTMGRIVPY
jgi:hypothetical protein